VHMRTHTRLTMIIPSMGRPEGARQAALSALDNAVLPTTAVIVAVDGPHEYGQVREYTSIARPGIGVAFDDRHRGMVATLNRYAILHVGSEMLVDHLSRNEWLESECRTVITHVGFMGDDHRVRTRGWDQALTEAAGPVGIAYGDDLIQGVELPTAVVMGADIVRMLGQMVPPTLQHLFVDDYWKALGIGIGALEYVPDVVIEHLHPSAGKAEMDESYAVTNHPDRYESDGAAWRAYRDDGPLHADLDRLSVLIHRWPQLMADRDPT
jgi:hypothetical protein